MTEAVNQVIIGDGLRVVSLLMLAPYDMIGSLDDYFRPVGS